MARVTNGLSDDPDNCSAEFRLSITKALSDQLHKSIQVLPPAPLNASTIGALHPGGGVYQLYLDGELIYIGKADKSLVDRLSQHERKISGRTGFHESEMTFTCLYVVEDLSAMAPERLLIDHYRGDGRCPWNTNGFGNKDPGRNRDRTLVKTKHFDAVYPINLGVEVSVPDEHTTVRAFLDSLKTRLPYTVRFHEDLKKKSGVALSPLAAGEENAPAEMHFERVLSSLPEGWQLTALPGYAILYEESQEYPSALALSRRLADGSVKHTAGPRLFDARDPVEDEPADDGTV